MKWRILLVLLCLQIPCLATWYNNGWAYRAKITTQNGKIDADLTDYPIYVKLDDFGAGHGIWSHVRSDGADIRVTKSDGTTEVPIEVVKIDTTNKVGELHFKASGTLSGTSNADFYLYYGNGDAAAYATSATYGSDNVWDSSYQAVWHNQATSPLDSTANNNDATGTSVALGVGMVGNGVVSDASTDNISAADSASLSVTNNLLLEWWQKITTSNQLFVLGKHNSTGNQRSYYCLTDTNVSATGMDFGVDNTGANTTRKIYRGGTETAATWYYMAMTFGSSALKIYKNGSDITSGLTKVADNAMSSIYDSTAAFRMFQSAGGINAAIGTIDEVRLSNSIRSVQYLTTTYNNQNSPSTFYTLAAEESGGTPAVVPNAIDFGTWF